MSTQYQLWLYDAYGNRVAGIDNAIITKLAYTLTANAVGSLTLTVPRDALPDAYVVQDAAIEVWRKPDGGAMQLEGQTQWLVTKDTKGLNNGERYRRIVAEPLITLLSRRYILYYNFGVGASITAPADYAMHDIVMRNYNSDLSPIVVYHSIPTRIWSSDLFQIASTYPQLGPSISKEYPFRNVLSTLQEIGRTASDAGTPIYFDVISVGGVNVAFRTWANIRGVDRSSGTSLLVVSAERGSLGGTIEATTDWSDTASVVVAGGAGQGSARTFGTAYDSARIGQSRFGEIEYFFGDGQVSDQASADDDAAAELRRHRALKTLTGDLVSVPGAVYGLDWSFGDKIKAEFEDDSFTAHVDSVTVTLDKGQETVSASIRADT